MACVAAWAYGGGSVVHGEPELVSGRQEMLENVVNDYLYSKDIA